MTENKYFTYDSILLDPAKTVAYDDDIFGPVTVFKDVVIAREIVHQYEDGMAYKPAKELENAYWTADGRWARAGGHPSSTIIASKDDINGRTVNPRFTKSLLDPKTRRPNNRGIVADLMVFNNRIASDMLEDMKSGRKTDVSIGFFFDRDDTSGVIEEDGHPLNGTKYDYVQRNFIIDHTAFALEKGMGRCPLPYCGLGADRNDEKEVAGDPFGEYEDFDDCVAKNQDKDDPEAYCATIERKIKEARKKKRDTPRTEAERAMAHFNLSEEEWEQLSDEEKQEYIDRLPERGSANMKDDLRTALETLLKLMPSLQKSFDDLVEEEYQGNVTPITESERAKRYFNISDEDWDALTEGEKEDYISRLPPLKKGPEEGKGDEGDVEAEEQEQEQKLKRDTVKPRKSKADISEIERTKQLLQI